MDVHSYLGSKRGRAHLDPLKHVIRSMDNRQNQRKLHSSRQLIRLDPCVVWPYVRTLFDVFPCLMEKIVNMIGPNCRMVSSDVVRNKIPYRQVVHRDHLRGFGRSVNLAIDLDGNPLQTYLGFYSEDQTDGGTSCPECYMVYDSYRLHCAASVKEYPHLRHCQNRLFCVFTDVDAEDSDLLLRELGTKRRPLYPPTIC